VVIHVPLAEHDGGVVKYVRRFLPTLRVWGGTWAWNLTSEIPLPIFRLTVIESRPTSSRKLVKSRPFGLSSVTTTMIWRFALKSVANVLKGAVLPA
jgi:hypothetical protein